MRPLQRENLCTENSPPCRDHAQVYLINESLKWKNLVNRGWRMLSEWRAPRCWRGRIRLCVLGWSGCGAEPFQIQETLCFGSTNYRDTVPYQSATADLNQALCGPWMKQWWQEWLWRLLVLFPNVLSPRCTLTSLESLSVCEREWMVCVSGDRLMTWAVFLPPACWPEQSSNEL